MVRAAHERCEARAECDRVKPTPHKRHAHYVLAQHAALRANALRTPRAAPAHMATATTSGTEPPQLALRVDAGRRQPTSRSITTEHETSGQPTSALHLRSDLAQASCYRVRVDHPSRAVARRAPTRDGRTHAVRVQPAPCAMIEASARRRASLCDVGRARPPLCHLARRLYVRGPGMRCTTWLYRIPWYWSLSQSS